MAQALNQANIKDTFLPQFKRIQTLWFLSLATCLFAEITDFEKDLQANPAQGTANAVVLSETCVVNDRYSK